jgi:hypothetical protein
MTTTEREILEGLIELETAVSNLPVKNPKTDLRPIFARIDRLTGELPSSTDPALLHYLHKRSYQKARLFLEGRDAENAAGSCHGHVRPR